jgi:hypothetical protein
MEEAVVISSIFGWTFLLANSTICLRIPSEKKSSLFFLTFASSPLSSAPPTAIKKPLGMKKIRKNLCHASASFFQEASNLLAKNI